MDSRRETSQSGLYSPSLQSANSNNANTSTSTVVSSISSPFRSSSSSSLVRTGNAAFDHDAMETMEYFDCEVDVGYADEGSKLAGLLVRLPCYGPHSRARDFCYLRVNSCSTKDATKYIADYTIEKKSCSMEDVSDEEIAEIIRRAMERSRRIYRRRTGENPSIVCFIDSLYYTLEERNYPDKRVIIRDFCYSVYDPRHWGRLLPSLLDRVSASCSYRAQAKFDFTAAAEGELSIRKNDLLYVLADFGNGWLSVRRPYNNRNTSDDDGPPSPTLDEKDKDSSLRDDSVNEALTGLVPENYVERLG